MLAATAVITSNKLPGMSGRIDAAVRDILTKGALDIYAASIPYTPVDTGALRANVTANETGVYWHQHYAGHQNWGTVRGVTPTLFANIAFEQTAPGIIAALESIPGRLV